jgi:hypothetical protein
MVDLLQDTMVCVKPAELMGLVMRVFLRVATEN